MDWSNKLILKFIDIYSLRQCIWDTKHKYHKNRVRVSAAWEEIKNEMGIPCTVEQLKKKKESLMASYRFYKARVNKSILSGDDESDVYEPSWYAFTAMDAFLGRLFECRPTSSNEEDPLQKTTVEDSNSGHSEEENVAIEFVQDSAPVIRESSHQGSIKQESLQQASTSKRKSRDPPELNRAKKKMNEAYDLLNNVYEQQQPKDEDDECDLFGKLISKKLRKVPEDRRDRLMHEIYQLVYEENYLA